MLALLLYAEVWFGSARLIARDLLQFFLPIGETLAQAWHGDGSFLWDSSINNGMPFAARWTPAVFYPAHALFAVLSVDRALSVAIILHFPVAAVATMQLALRYTASRPAAWLAGLGYGFGGYCLSMSGGGIYLYGAALLPLDLLALHRLLEHPSSTRLAQLALVVCLQILCADPQTLFYGMLVLWPLVLILRGRVGQRRRVWLSAALAAALGVGLAFCQLWPTVELAGLSVRAHGLGLGEVGTWAFHPLRLLEVVVPSVFGSITPDNTYWARALINNVDASMPWAPAVHVGLLLLVGLLWVWQRHQRRDVLLWAGASLFFLLCAFGPRAPLHNLLVSAVPGADRFRYPEKFMVFVGLGLALLGAMGLGRLLSGEGGLSAPRRRGWLALAGLGFLLVALRLWSAAAPGWFEGLIARMGSVSASAGLLQTAEALARSGAIALLLMLVLLGWPRLRPSLRVGLLLGIATAELFLAGLPLRQLGDRRWLAERPLACRHLPGPERGLAPLVWRFGLTSVPDGPLGRGLRGRMEKQRRWELHSLRPNLGAPRCVRHMDGYEASQLALYKLLLSEIADHRRPALAPIFGLRFALTAPGQLDPRSYPLHAEVPSLNLAIHRMPGLPFAYSVAAAEAAGSGPDAVARVIGPDFALDKRVVLEGPGPWPAAPAARRKVELVSHRSGRIELQADFEAPGYLVVLESFYPGWRATVDGRPADLRRANGLFMGLPLAAGSHLVRLSFAPSRQRAGNAVSLVSLGLAVLLLVVGARLRRT